MSDNLAERVQILCHAHIICITVLEHKIIPCKIFCDLLLKSAFERIFNAMQVILVRIKWHIKWKYLIKKFHDICLSYYFKWHAASNTSILASYIVDMIDVCSYMLLKWKAKKIPLWRNCFKILKIKGESEKMTARIPGLIQGIA